MTVRKKKERSGSGAGVRRGPGRIMWQHLCTAALICLAVRVQAQASGEPGEADEPSVDTTHFIRVRKCCPEAHMMVEGATPTGPRIECRPHNSSLAWAPDYLDDNNIAHSFVESLLPDNSTDDNMLCANDNGPCILPIIGKPQCGPVTHSKSALTYLSFNYNCIKQSKQTIVLPIV